MGTLIVRALTCHQLPATQSKMVIGDKEPSAVCLLPFMLKKIIWNSSTSPRSLCILTKIKVSQDAPHSPKGYLLSEG
jgi:hypothetical protein